LDSEEEVVTNTQGKGFFIMVWGVIHSIFKRILGFVAGIKNPWIINTVAACTCFLIVVATVAFVPSLFRASSNAGKTVEVATEIPVVIASDAVKILKDTSQTTSEGSEGLKNLLTGEKEQPRPEYASATDPMTSYENSTEAFASETHSTITSGGGAQVTAVLNDNPGSLFSSEPLDLRLPEDSVRSLRDPSLKRNLQRRGAEIKSERRKATDEIFDRVDENIPSFVRDNYEERNNGETFINLMNRQLLSEEELEIFIANTAMDIDFAIAEEVSKHLNAKFVKIDFNTDTGKELKKRLPTAREICESIYQELERKNLNSAYKSQLNEAYDRLVLKHPELTQISKVAFVVIVSYLFPPTAKYAVGALAISWLRDVKIYEQRTKFEKELKNQFNDRRTKFKKLVERQIDSLINVYADELAKTDVVIQAPSFKP